MAPCRLVVWEGDRSPRLYWSIGSEIFRPEVITSPQPCPFAGPSFQLMRNMCFAVALSQKSRRDWFGFLVTYVAGAPNGPELVEEVEEFRSLLRPPLTDRVSLVSYETIAEVLVAAGERELAEWIKNRIATVLGGPIL